MQEGRRNLAFKLGVRIKLGMVDLSRENKGGAAGFQRLKIGKPMNANAE